MSHQDSTPCTQLHSHAASSPASSSSLLNHLLLFLTRPMTFDLPHTTVNTSQHNRRPVQTSPVQRNSQQQQQQVCTIHGHSTPLSSLNPEGKRYQSEERFGPNVSLNVGGGGGGRGKGGGGQLGRVESCIWFRWWAIEVLGFGFWGGEFGKTRGRIVSVVHAGGTRGANLS